MPPTSTAEPHRYLFVLWEGGGNVPPQLTLARKLIARGHSVRVLADPCVREDAETIGCTFVPFTRAPFRPDRSVESDIVRDWDTKSPLQAFARVRDRIMAGPALQYAEDVLEELRREGADVVAVDWVLFGALAGAERAGVPAASLVHSVWQVPTPGMPAPGPGFLPMRGPLGRVRDALFGRMFLRFFAMGLPAINKARAALGLAAVRDMREMLERVDRVLVLTSRAFDYRAQVLPANVRYVGPQVDDPAWADAWRSPWPADHPDPLVVVSLSTTPQGQTGVLQRVVNALEGMPVRALVTTGPAVDPQSILAPANVVVRRSAPHARVFPEASGVITHAGHGTVIRALAAGVPLLCLPMGRDQPDIAARVVHHGVGLRLSPRAGTAALRKSIARLLEDPRFRERAEQLSGVIAEEVRNDEAVRELEALAVSRGPSPKRMPHPGT